MPINSAEDLLLDELRAIYNAEKQVTRALPRLSKRVQHDHLRELLDQRREQGDRLIDELDRVFERMQTSKGRRKNTAVEGLLEDANHLAEDIDDPQVLDAATIAAVQKIEHYCIAAWGTAKSLGESLEIRECVDAMQRALDEGKQYDEELTRLAEEEVNMAMGGMEEDMEEGEEMDEEQEQQRSRGVYQSRGGQSRSGQSGGRSQSGQQSQSRSQGQSGARSGGGGQSQGRQGQQQQRSGQSQSGQRSGGQSRAGQSGSRRREET